MAKAGSAASPRSGPVLTGPVLSGPLWLNAELTYRCPLHCVYCYNPINYTECGPELETHDWLRVLQQARELGAVQLGLSGGEPLLRSDLERLIAHARGLGYYTNLITSGVGLNETRVAALKRAGLDHIQLSFQDSTAELNDFLSGTKSWQLKQRVARLVKNAGYPMVLNVVLHRLNLQHVTPILEMALALGADHVELANTQYYGWAYQNRDHLLPSREQVASAEREVEAFRSAAGGTMKIYLVVPDYHGTRPKRCVNGWGTTLLNVTPDGLALPCHEARILPGLSFPNVRDHGLDWIWREAPAFNRYRGTAWMREPCHSCPEKERDLGGCRCQAFLLTGDASAADPVCALAPGHEKITAIVAAAAAPRRSLPLYPLAFRGEANARSLCATASEPHD